MNGGIYSEDGKTCYKVVSLGKHWDPARKYCQNEFKNGDLAAVSNLKIKQTLERGLTKESIENGLWIGGNKVDGQWQWSNGDAWDFENWASGEPNKDASQKEIFVRLNPSHEWRDWNINTNSFFLCEWKM